MNDRSAEPAREARPVTDNRFDYDTLAADPFTPTVENRQMTIRHPLNPLRETKTGY
jgi:hypothetical protein